MATCEICSGLQFFGTLLLELRAPIGIGGEMVWNLYDLMQNLLILHLNIEN